MVLDFIGQLLLFFNFFFKCNYTCMSTFSEEPIQINLNEKLFIGNTSKRILLADKSCTSESAEPQTFICYNGGKCEASFTYINETHEQRDYYCKCATVSFILILKFI